MKAYLKYIEEIKGFQTSSTNKLEKKDTKKPDKKMKMQQGAEEKPQGMDKPTQVNSAPGAPKPQLNRPIDFGKKSTNQELEAERARKHNDSGYEPDQNGDGLPGTSKSVDQMKSAQKSAIKTPEDKKSEEEQLDKFTTSVEKADAKKKQKLQKALGIQQFPQQQNKR